MAWETQNVTSDFDARSYTNNQIAGREGARSGAIGSANTGGVGNLLNFANGSAWGNTGGYSIVGMDITKVDATRAAISDYVAAIENHVNGIDALADANNAYKSEEVQSAVRSYVEKVKEYCINLCSQLRAFSDKLADAKAAWESGAANIASTVSSGAGSFDAGTKYTEQK